MDLGEVAVPGLDRVAPAMKLRERPSYREAIAAHEHPTVVRGGERLRRAKAARPELRAALEGA